jgi:hypothetical protein
MSEETRTIGTMVQLVDDLADEIRRARAIESAIVGLGDDPGDDEKLRGVAGFQYDHVQRLVSIKDRLDALRARPRRRGSLTVLTMGNLGPASAGLFRWCVTFAQPMRIRDCGIL